MRPTFIDGLLRSRVRLLLFPNRLADGGDQALHALLRFDASLLAQNLVLLARRVWVTRVLLYPLQRLLPRHRRVSLSLLFQLDGHNAGGARGGLGNVIPVRRHGPKSGSARGGLGNVIPVPRHKLHGRKSGSARGGLGNVIPVQRHGPNSGSARGIFLKSAHEFGLVLGPFGLSVGLVLGPFGLSVGLESGHFGLSVGLESGHFGLSVGLVLGPFGLSVGLVLSPFGLSVGLVLGPFGLNVGLQLCELLDQGDYGSSKCRVHHRQYVLRLESQALLLHGLSRLHRGLPQARVVGRLQKLAHDAGVAHVDALREASRFLAHTGHVKLHEQLVDVFGVHVDDCHGRSLAEPNRIKIKKKSKIKQRQI